MSDFGCDCSMSCLHDQIPSVPSVNATSWISGHKQTLLLRTRRGCKIGCLSPATKKTSLNNLHVQTGAAAQQIKDTSVQRAAAIAQPPLKQLPSLNRLEEFLFGPLGANNKLPLSHDLLNQLRQAARLHSTISLVMSATHQRSKAARPQVQIWVENCATSLEGCRICQYTAQRTAIYVVGGLGVLNHAREQKGRPTLVTQPHFLQRFYHIRHF